VVKLEVVQVATPEPLTVWEPQPLIVVPPLVKLTVPVGVLPPPETVAVRVVLAPTVGEVGLEVRTVEVVPNPTVSERVPVEVL
jgi:hypothetical protein